MASVTFDAIGTTWQIDFPNTSSPLDPITTKIHQTIEAFDITYSRFRSDSLITRIAHHAGTYTFPDNAEQLFDLYWNLYKLSDELFTPLIGSTLSAAGYDALYSLHPAKHIPTPPKWEDVMEYSHPTLQTKQPILLDVGAAGKGYLIDIVAEVIEGFNISTYTIDASGDILYRNEDHTPARIGLENPFDTTKVIGIVNLENQSICASAGNRRTWNTYHHIINPRTKTSPQDVLATWVIADTALVADGLATCLFLVSPDKLQRSYTFEYGILKNNSIFEKSAHFPAELFI